MSVPEENEKEKKRKKEQIFTQMTIYIFHVFPFHTFIADIFYY